MSTAPITQVTDALHRVELAGTYHRAARARRLAVPQVELAALEHLDVLGGLTPGALGRLPAQVAEIVARPLDELAKCRGAAAAATPGPERVYPTDGYSRALLM